RDATFALADAQTIDIRIPLTRGAVIAGQVLDAWGDPLDSAHLTVFKARGAGPMRVVASVSCNDAGTFRIGRLLPGSYVLLATPARRRPLVSKPSARDPEPVPTYYPGVVTADEAVPIEVDDDHAVTNVDLVIQQRVTAEVRGALVDTTGEAVHVSGIVMFRPLSNRLPRGTGSSFVERVDADGTFAVHVPPDEYEVAV